MSKRQTCLEIGGETEEREENRTEQESYHFCIRAGKQAGSSLRISNQVFCNLNKNDPHKHMHLDV